MVKSDVLRMGRLYDELAFLMPLISPPADYAEEAVHWRQTLRGLLGDGRHRILELGVGGGHNLSHLTSDFEATAVDLSEAMLELCRQLNPGVKLFQGDMRYVRLGEKFAAVLIHDAISYMLTEADLLATFHTAAAHLDKGGVLITGPDHTRETYSDPAIDSATHAEAGCQVTYFEYTFDPNPDDTTVETLLIYLIRSSDGLTIEHDRHITGLFSQQTWLHLLDEAGFSAEIRHFWLEDSQQPYDLFVGKLR